MSCTRCSQCFEPYSPFPPLQQYCSISTSNQFQNVPDSITVLFIPTTATTAFPHRTPHTLNTLGIPGSHPAALPVGSGCVADTQRIGVKLFELCQIDSICWQQQQRGDQTSRICQDDAFTQWPAPCLSTLRWTFSPSSKCWHRARTGGWDPNSTVGLCTNTRKSLLGSALSLMPKRWCDRPHRPFTGLIWCEKLFLIKRHFVNALMAQPRHSKEYFGASLSQRGVDERCTLLILGETFQSYFSISILYPIC